MEVLGQEAWVEEQEASGLAEVRELGQATYLEVAMEATEVVMDQVVLVNIQELVELVPNLLKQVGLEHHLEEQDVGLVVLELDLVVQGLDLAVLELDLVVLELVLVVLDLDLSVQELGLAEQGLDLAVQELWLMEQGLTWRLVRRGEDLEGKPVVKHQNKFQALGCQGSIKVDSYQAKVLEYSARGVLDQEEQAMVVDSNYQGFFVVTLSYHQNQGVVLEDSLEEALESHLDLEVELEQELDLDLEAELEQEQELDLDLEAELEQELDLDLEAELEQEQELDLDLEAELEQELDLDSEAELEQEQELDLDLEVELEQELDLDSEVELEQELDLDLEVVPALGQEALVLVALVLVPEGLVMALVEPSAGRAFHLRADLGMMNQMVWELGLGMWLGLPIQDASAKARKYVEHLEVQESVLVGSGLVVPSQAMD
ncbi:fibroin heavy chain-like protein [Lates japonicus]|uniref:Fibroin heavy chain-like protein n=1 Tax=Lates japonicus TaxID=270547 RepID=A0AAD3M2Q1_LATJO|nr:fibroin heavy chain-like protein [Lates japonicus]